MTRQYDYIDEFFGIQKKLLCIGTKDLPHSPRGKHNWALPTCEKCDGTGWVQR